MDNPKSKHREYVDAIKHTKERFEVDMGYQPFLINRALWTDEILILHINYINLKPLKVTTPDTKEQRLFEKQIPFQTDKKLIP